MVTDFAVRSVYTTEWFPEKKKNCYYAKRAPNNIMDRGNYIYIYTYYLHEEDTSRTWTSVPSLKIETTGLWCQNRWMLWARDTIS